MPIFLSPETEAKVQEQARLNGESPDSLVETYVNSMLAREAQDRAEAIEGIRRGLEDSEAGRVKPIAETLTKLDAILQHPQQAK